MAHVRMQSTLVGKEEVAFSGWWEFGAVHGTPTVRKQRMCTGAQLTFTIFALSFRLVLLSVGLCRPHSGWLSLPQLNLPGSRHV